MKLLFLFRGEFTGKNVKLKIKYCFESFNRRKVTGNFKYCNALNYRVERLILYASCMLVQFPG